MNEFAPPYMPPHSVEAEQSLIGGILIENRAMDRVADLVTEADFYRDEHRRIYRQITKLIDQGWPADVVTVFESLEKNGEVEQTGGLTYLAEIANNTPSAANIRRYAEIVAERAMMRGLQRIAAELQTACTRPDGRAPVEIAAMVEAEMLRLLDRTDGDPVPLYRAMHEVLADVDARRNRGGEFAGLTTGFRGLDEMTGGLEPGQLVIVAARPSVGKTIFGCNVATAAAMAGTPTLFFTLEMTRREIGSRILAARSGVTVQTMRSGTSAREDWDAMGNSIAAAGNWPMHIDDRPAITVPYVRAKARRIQRTAGLGLIVIDYLQLMRGTGDTRAQEVGSVSRGLKALAKELNVPVIALAQLNRATESRPDRRPTLADLRDSGEIEQDADIVIMLHRESFQREAPEWANLAEMLIRKNRNGPTGDCLLAINGALMRFSDYDGPSPRDNGPVRSGRGRGFEA